MWLSCELCTCKMAERIVHVWGERAEDDITMLPKEWEARVADDSRVFFLK